MRATAACWRSSTSSGLYVRWAAGVDLQVGPLPRPRLSESWPHDQPGRRSASDHATLDDGWDVFCWLGHRRFARHWSVPQLRLELLDSYDIVLSEDAIEDYLQRYQCMLAARQQDPARLKEEYRKTR